MGIMAAERQKDREAMGKCLGVFDSGLGGLTVLGELLRQREYERYIYFGDTARVPYGPRDADTIRAFSLQDMRFLLSQGADELVVACNTITAVALDDLRAAAGVPVHGVIEPAAAAAVKATKNGQIGLLATQATVENGAYARMIAALDPAVRLAQQACPRFVTLVEAGAEPTDAAVIAACEEYLAPVRAAGCDTVILGCTHFPLLQSAIAAYFGPEVTLVNSSVELAGCIAGESGEREGAVSFFVSGDPAAFDGQRRRFLPALQSAPAQRVDIERF